MTTAITVRTAGMIGLAAVLAAFESSGSAAKSKNETNTIFIKRDAWGVPHVYAGSRYGWYYGYGYALAEDRLFQMEMLKRQSLGSLAEALGPKYVPHDRTARLILSRASIEQQYRALKAEDKAIFDGIAAGMNRRVEEIREAPQKVLPLEYAQLELRPERWSAPDIIAIFVSTFAERFNGFNSELDNLKLMTGLVAAYGPVRGHAIFDQLRWPHDSRAPATVEAKDHLGVAPPTYVPAERVGEQIAMPALRPPASTDQGAIRGAKHGGAGPDAAPRASNFWMVGRDKARDAEAILFNGPQMGHYAPGYLWAVGLHGAGINVVGSTTPGNPWVIFGTNGKIAWGATAGLGDTVDLYRETLHPDDEHQYLHKGKYLRMTSRDEIIRVRNGTPVIATYRSTIHGPVIVSDKANRTAFARKTSWSGSEVQSLLAWLKAMEAEDFKTWRSALSGAAISINNFYIDGHGNIGFTYTGRYPKRPMAQDFRIPASGTGEMEWTGFHPFAANPWSYNPAKGFIANWNNKPHANYNSSDSFYWGAVDRVEDIQERVGAKSLLATEDLWKVNGEIMFRDSNARFFLPLILEAAPGWSPEGKAAKAAAILEGWNGEITARDDPAVASAGHLLFRAFLNNLLLQNLGWIESDLDAAGHGYRGLLKTSPTYPSMGTQAVYNALLGSKAGVPQKFDLLLGRSPAEVIEDALEAAMDEMALAYSADPKQWSKPSEPHLFSTTFATGDTPSAPLGLARYAQSLPAIMNRGTTNISITFRRERVQICDVTPPGQSAFISLAGAKSRHWADQLGLYAANRCKPQLFYDDDIARSATTVKRLAYGSPVNASHGR